MIDFIRLGPTNLDILKSFIEQLGDSATTFRYFQSRPPEVIYNHLETWLMVEDGVSICYGHLDHENGIFWLGIALKPEHQGKGLATLMMRHLIQRASVNDVRLIYLTVDRNNQRAIALYEKFNFKRVDANENHYKYVLSLD